MALASRQKKSSACRKGRIDSFAHTVTAARYQVVVLIRVTVIRAGVLCPLTPDPRYKLFLRKMNLPE